MNQFAKLRAANAARHKVWPGADKVDLGFATIEFGGEAGELLNAVKKYMRATRGIAGNGPAEQVESRFQDIKDEMGDVLISLDLLARELDIDLAECVPDKFNKTSVKNMIPCLMDADTWETYIVN